LFEQFSHTGKVVIGVVSEGTDVAVFSAAQAEKLWQHLSNIQSDYYFPFRMELQASDNTLNKQYLLVNAGKSVNLLPNHPRTMAGSVEVSIVSHYDLTLLQGNETPLSIFNADGTEESDEHSLETYAIELIGDNKFMSIQSWGQGLQNGAFEHFMEFESDEVE